MENEIWKDIPDYKGRYKVSNFGRVKSLGNNKTKKTKILKPLYVKAKKYPFFIFSVDGVRKEHRIHHLVASAFMGERPLNYHICHKDGNPLNNNLSNLRYDTASENNIDQYRYGKKNGAGKLTTEQVLEVRHMYRTGKYYQREIAEIFGLSRRCINDIVNKVSFKWLNDDGTIDESKTQTK